MMQHLLRKHTALFLLLLVFAISARAQFADTCHSRKIIFWSAAGLAGGGSLGALATLWYDEYRETDFRWYNDNSDWLQMDKAGHMMSAYHLSDLLYNSGRWACLKDPSAQRWASLIPLGYLSMIEVMDGYSEGWGASWGDVAANIAGTGLFIVQQRAWKEQRIRLKWSYHRTSWAEIRPSILGKGLAEEMLKDYNGQTYWLSFNLKSLKIAPAAPKWLNLAIGYGADGMIGGRNNTDWQTSATNIYNPARRRQFYMSPDIDLTHIAVKSPWLKTALRVLSFVKIPSPGIGYEQGKGLVFHALYF